MTPQQKQIMSYIADGDWHCMTNGDFFMKDDRKRISELNDIGKMEGFEIEGKPCDGRCQIKHHSGIKMRRLVNKQKVLTCCTSWILFSHHEKGCEKARIKEAQTAMF